MHKTFHFLIFFLLLISCKSKKINDAPIQEVSFNIFELEISDKETLSNGGCIIWNDGILEAWKKVAIANNKYDTLYIPVWNCAESNKLPFINYDKLEYFEFDSTKTSNLIYTSKGRELILYMNDTVMVFLKTPDKRKKHKFFADIKVDSLGVQKYKYFSFSE